MLTWLVYYPENPYINNLAGVQRYAELAMLELSLK